MSEAVFPDLPGLAWSNIKTPIWSTTVKTSVSGRETRAANFSFPIYQFKLSYEFLRANARRELQILVGFFNLMKGSFDTFLYQDPDDHTAAGERFGVGDGVTREFQLARDLGAYSDPIFEAVAPQVYGNGAMIGQPNNYFVINSEGQTNAAGTQAKILFVNPPAPGVVLTWSGSFYYRCRFAGDSSDFEQFMKNLWTNKKVELKSVKP